MPVPEGQITTSEIWNTPEKPTEPEKKELTEEQRLDIALKIHKGEL